MWLSSKCVVKVPLLVIMLAPAPVLHDTANVEWRDVKGRCLCIPACVL